MWNNITLHVKQQGFDNVLLFGTFVNIYIYNESLEYRHRFSPFKSEQNK